MGPLRPTTRGCGDASAYGKCPALSTPRYLQDNNRADKAAGKVKVTGWRALCNVPMQLLMEILGQESSNTANNEAELVVESAKLVALTRPGGGAAASEN